MKNYTHEMKDRLKEFWLYFDNNHVDGGNKTRIEKLQVLQYYASMVFIYKSPALNRWKFQKIKHKRHNLKFYKNCFICKNKADVRHHIICLKNGGINSKKNLVSLCNKCHSDIHKWLKKR